jgi:hypothetical protein
MNRMRILFLLLATAVTDTDVAEIVPEVSSAARELLGRQLDGRSAVFGPFAPHNSHSRVI